MTDIPDPARVREITNTAIRLVTVDSVRRRFTQAALAEHGIDDHDIPLWSAYYDAVIADMSAAAVGVWSTTDTIHAILNEVAGERERQIAKWGVQRHRDGTGGAGFEDSAAGAKAVCQAAERNNRDGAPWRLILAEEVAEAFAESDPVALRAELVQVCAVAAAWIEDIDSRDGAAADVPTGPAQWAIWSYVHGGWRTDSDYTIDVGHASRFTAHKARALIDAEARAGLADGKPRSLMMLGPEVRTADDDVTVMNSRLKWAFQNEMAKYGADGQRADLAGAAGA